FVTFLKIFCSPNTCFDRHNVAAIFVKHGSLPLSLADPSIYRNHSPAIGHESQNVFQVARRLRRNGNEVPWGWPPPVPNLAVELDVHCSVLTMRSICFRCGRS